MKYRHILLKHGPHGIKVHAKIGMNKPISRPCDLPPGNRSLGFRQRRTEVFDCFTNNFELANNGALCFTISEEAATTVCGEVLNIGNLRSRCDSGKAHHARS